MKEGKNMKVLSSLVLGMTVLTSAAFANQWSNGSGHWDRWHPGHAVCTVTFKKCDFNINGFCVKWNNKGFQVGYREARWACRRAQQEYGMIKNCQVRCY
jgi:hypothetical protein